MTAARQLVATGSGLGKLILCGEHAVVHGSGALAVAIDRQMRVTLRAGGFLAPAGADAKLLEALRQLGELPFAVHIDSELPVGRGMGSSAALCVALVRATEAARGRSPSPAEVRDRAMGLERVFHGNPSGLDVAVSEAGGLIAFRRGPPLTIEAVPLPDRAWRLVVLDSGSAGDTSELVAGVASRRPAIDPHLDAIARLVEQARATLADPMALGALLTENHRLLDAIGVSTPVLDALVTLALDAGAYGAKLSGAGGGGVVVALVDDPEPVLQAARARGISAFECRPATRRAP